jgi:hypothetical protein
VIDIKTGIVCFMAMYAVFAAVAIGIEMTREFHPEETGWNGLRRVAIETIREWYFPPILTGIFTAIPASWYHFYERYLDAAVANFKPINQMILGGSLLTMVVVIVLVRLSLTIRSFLKILGFMKTGLKLQVRRQHV